MIGLFRIYHSNSHSLILINKINQMLLTAVTC